MSYLDIIPKKDREAFKLKGSRSRVGFGRKPAVLVVDVTYGFVDPKYATASKTSKEMGGEAVDAIKTLLERARRVQIPIIYSRPADETGLLFDIGVSRKFARNKRAYFDHREGEIVDKIAPRRGDLLVNKMRASAFFGTPILSYLIFNDVDTLIVTGMTTSGCVRASVVDAASYNYRVIIPEECVADRSVISHKVSLFDMAMKYADVLKMTEVLDHLDTIVPDT